MSLTVGCSFVIARLDILPAAVDSVAAWVDRFYFLVDSRAPAEVFDFLESRRLPYDRYGWCDDYSHAYNTAHEALGTDWGVTLDGDETLALGHGPLLRALAEQGEAFGHDAFTAPRRHWLDLEMTRPYPPFAGDRVLRLRRASFRYVRRVHSEPTPGAAVADRDGPVIEHFNMALRTPEQWAGVNAYYARLAALDPR